MKQKLPSRKRKREVGADAAEAPHRQSIKAVSQPTRLGQAYLTFGTKPLHITCGKCGMQYTKLSREDDSLHAQYCKNVVGPILWHSTPHQTFYKTRSVTLLKKKETPQTSLQGYIIIVPYKEANKVVQAKLQEIAARIDGVLNASPISNEDMEASTFYVMTKSHTVSSALKKQQVVGCAISRPIRTAYRAVAKSPTSVSSEDKQRNRLSPSDEVDSAVLCSSVPVPAKVGVDRIWTEESYRGWGVAESLLDAIASESIYGAPILEPQRRDIIAFSQPTDAGTRLFKHWTGTPAFLVFAEEQ